MRLQFAIGVTTLVAAAVSLDARQQVRDGARVTTGTAVLAGIAVSDDAEARPLRRARVMINNAERTVGRTVVTGDDGAFGVADLPAGRYTVSGTKDGYVTVVYGAKRIGRPGTPIVLDEGQQVTDLVLRIPRGAVLTGTVLDEDGQPLSGAFVRTALSVIRNGEGTFVPAGTPQTTDDRGVYRIYGLMPGEYLVSGSARLGGHAHGLDVRAVSDEDVRRALREITTPFTSSRPGQLTPDESYRPPPDDRAGPVAYAPVYYPGVMFPEQAARLTLAAGEERRGVDFQLPLVPTATIEGTVTAPPGVSPHVTVNMVAAGLNTGGFLGAHFQAARADAEGRFRFRGIAPGQYSILARGGPTAAPGRGRGAPPAGGPQYWAQADIVVDGRDVSGVLLALQPGLTVSGLVRFDGSSAEPSQDPSKVRVMLQMAGGVGEIRLSTLPAQMDANGTFTITGVTPGRYHVAASVMGPAPKWFLSAAAAGGADIFDAPLDLQPTRPPGEIVLSFTDRPTELTGLVQDASGAPAPGYHIVVFTTDRSRWAPRSRRIQAGRPSADGRYTFRNLPPGEYHLAAVEDVEPGEWFDPAFLQRLVDASVTVTLAEHERKTQDLRLDVR